MEESVKVTSAVLDKKMETYRWEANDYVAERELTITITLAEYRSLIAAKATRDHDIAAANADKYNRDAENKRLKEVVEELRARMYEMQNERKYGQEN